MFLVFVEDEAQRKSEPDEYSCWERWSGSGGSDKFSDEHFLVCELNKFRFFWSKPVCEFYNNHDPLKSIIPVGDPLKQFINHSIYATKWWFQLKKTKYYLTGDNFTKLYLVNKW